MAAAFVTKELVINGEEVAVGERITVGVVGRTLQDDGEGRTLIGPFHVVVPLVEGVGAGHEVGRGQYWSSIVPDLGLDHARLGTKKALKVGMTAVKVANSAR